jgi:hypothetical protein
MFGWDGPEKELPEGQGIESVVEADAGNAASQRGPLTLERNSTANSKLGGQP